MHAASKLSSRFPDSTIFPLGCWRIPRGLLSIHLLMPDVSHIPTLAYPAMLVVAFPQDAYLISSALVEQDLARLYGCTTWAGIEVQI